MSFYPHTAHRSDEHRFFVAVLDLSFVVDGKGFSGRTGLKFTTACCRIPTASVKSLKLDQRP
ncbi:hypothetical protein F2Q69_00053145 [Brassica cretica]|uniref:Uncharacterized protein n=1 Tax=Brassica cretica TaxID=69181 RepID=A0A8S9NAR7_BRACR|nr:hypothetical protein F2Q69_00053145 [Brassica cretica]